MFNDQQGVSAVEVMMDRIGPDLAFPRPLLRNQFNTLLWRVKGPSAYSIFILNRN